MPAGLVQIGSDQNHRKEKQPATVYIYCFVLTNQYMYNVFIKSIGDLN